MMRQGARREMAVKYGVSVPMAGGATRGLNRRQGAYRQHQGGNFNAQILLINREKGKAGDSHL